MSSEFMFFRCIFSPALYRIYNAVVQQSQMYQPNVLESVSDFTIRYAFPVGVTYSLWHRKFQYVLYLSIALASSYAIRAAGRVMNPKYVEFIQTLRRAQQYYNVENAERLRLYDFEFSGWPTSFRSDRIASLGKSNETSKYNPSWFAGWLLAHSFGIRMIYPGTILGFIIKSPLQDARAKLVLENKGERNKVVTADGNYIDTMYFDNRSKGGLGKTLVICCEGNAGFYEVGMLGTPLGEGYSVLGWNHPGFGGSSGVPYPQYELNAAEAVFHFATTELKYNPEDIIIYSWSIGGYPAAYLANKYSTIKGLILDATFDDVLPLAYSQMPAFLGPLVKSTIRSHVNLHVSQLLEGYKGPLRFIRRTEDEIIAEPPKVLRGNRGNFLLRDIMYQRYPELMNDETERDLMEWLSAAHESSGARFDAIPEPLIPSKKECAALSATEKTKLVINIMEKLLTDFKSSHCMPLPGSLFRIPWIPSSPSNKA